MSMTPEEALERLVGWATNDASGYGEKAQKQVNEAEAVLRRALREGVRGWAMPPKHIYGDAVIRVYLDRQPKGSKPVRVVEVKE